MQGWTLVFDLDGTLVDTAPDLAAATNHVLARAGLAPINAREILPFVGHGAMKMIKQALAAHGQSSSETELREHFDIFIAHYSANIAALSRPYPGAIEALTRFQSEGATLAVCTNKMEIHARALLDELDMSKHFAALTGGNSLGVSKPNPKHLTGTIELAKGKSERAIMIGDSETDIRTAQAAGIPVIAVNFGYSVEPVGTFAPDVVIGHYDELHGAISALTAARSA
jgi:phosphoglycolate phosphatase